MDDPRILLLLTLGGLYLGKMWRDDCLAARAGRPHPGQLPGATPAAKRAIGIAALGAILLTALETLGEHILGLTSEQSRMTWLFAIYSLAAAPIIEEIVFRGWLVPERRGPVVRGIAVVGASLIFALLHPFLWHWGDDGLAFTPGIKGWFNTTAQFIGSLWFYACRLGPWNPTRSLLPCFVAHGAKNAAVIVAKASAGAMGNLW